MTLRLGLDTSVITTYLAQVQDQITQSLRPAAQAGAQVYYEALLNEYDRMVGVESGNLRKAIYQKWRGEKSDDTKQVYAISWAGKGSKASQHGHLIEYGFIRRYQAVKNKRGEWVTAVRKEMQGKPAPKRRASQAEKDAYYVLRKGGPVQVLARPFMRNTVRSQTNRQQAIIAMRLKLFESIGR